jgi:cellulose synthase/poly-beta-1,6-N-acetylglucosamine synthase-like glycosyltransferase/peptidoglycan/xylan/chitin deacetylase (PgdA/CDA1 family)/spore germination protein YaaH
MEHREGRPPVFYDPHQRRWRWVKRAAQIAGLIGSGLFTAVVGAVLINPALPSLGLRPSANLPQRHHLAPPKPERPAGYLEHRFRRSKSALEEAAVGGKASSRPIKPSPPARAFPCYAFFVNWDDASQTSLRLHLDQVDLLVPEWLHLDGTAGGIKLDDEPRQIEVTKFVRERRPALPIVPLINNFDGVTMTWESNQLGAVLASAPARQQLIANLLAYIQQRQFAGVNIDFESVPAASQPHLLRFMTELYAAFKPHNLQVSQSVPLDDPAFDYRGLARVNDALLLMAYDEHASESDAGPVASHDWFADLVSRRGAEIGPSKAIVALGNYGYDWRDKSRNGDEVSFQDALRIARESEGKITLAADSLNPAFDYYDDQNKFRHVWFLDAVTAFNSLRVLRDEPWHGIALWRLGSEDPSIWTLLARRTDLGPATAQALSSLRYGYDVDYEGQGEVLQVTATPSDGSRTVAVDPTSGLIIGEQLTAFPSPYVITRRGHDARKLIALTFDDGPDPVYTPAILATLAEKKVPATFFIIGLNADLHPSLLQRIVDAGHEIGNHTFTHPDVSQVSARQFRLEMNATERLFEARLGVRSLLFRPPYAEDIEPETPDQVAPLLFVSERGYYTIGMGIDPNDWQTPGVDAIIDRIMTGAAAGTGQIVLLHDSGGDRTQTVAALPAIIDGLRQRGFTLVSVSTLLGVPREAVMPPVPPSTRWLLTGADAAFLATGLGDAMLRLMFLLGIGLGLLRLLTICVLAILQKLRPHRVPHAQRAGAGTGAGAAAPLPPYAVIIPAYNEERVIVRTIASIRNSEPPPHEIIVVDDGSSDRTAEAARDAFGDDPIVKVFTKANAGKAHALNYGIAMTDAPVIVALDADTIFQPDTNRRLVAHLADPKIGAVAGNAKVGNRINLLTRWQALEYLTSQNLDRRAFDRLNCVTVVPGAVGAWRRDLVLKAGGFPADTLAEDADLTLAMLRQGTHVVYEERAIAWTEAPDTVSGLLKQRFRWIFGTLQAAWKQRDTFFRPRYGSLGLVALPNMLIFGVLFPLVSPLMDLQMLLSLIGAGWESRFHPNEFTGDLFAQTFFYYALFVAVDLLAAALAFALERHERWSLLVWLPLQRLVYRQLMYIVVIRAVVAAMRGQLVGWGKLERKATVT